MRGYLALRAAVILTVATIGLALLATPEAGAQTPPARPTPTDAQVLAVEQQLLCPICTNERLDVCSNPICNDMRRVIRERLAAGSTQDDIILYFETRYGPKVRAELPRQGFNLVLFGWVGGALVLSGLAAVYALYSLRRDTRRRIARATSTPAASDDRWVDALVDEAADDDKPGAPR
jgi:cytochrome c-type biogenesis protein CcmH